jgi:hypothetical protein
VGSCWNISARCEAYDKVARLLGLGYPGGPAIDRLARTGNAKAIRFPRGLTQPKYMGTAEEPGPHRYDWSFSGLKTAVARCVEQFEARGEAVPVADIAAAFQEAVVDVITSKAVLACRENGITELLLGGGVAANSRLRQLTEQRCSAAGIRLTVPPLSLCTDNGGTIPTMPPWHVQENKWRAARYGLDAIIILDAEGNEQLVTEHLRETLARLEPVAAKLGCSAELADVEKIIERGAGYQRQRRVAAAHGGDLRAVVLDLVEQMRKGPEA